MKYLTLFSLIFFCHSTIGNENTQKLRTIKVLQKFIFASCNREFLPQPLWPLMTAEKAQLFIWGGDNIYGDKKPFKDQIKKKYQIQNNIHGYKLFKATLPIIGIWDDHDYGKNNGGADYKNKELNREYLLDFLEVEKGAPVRKRDGVYQAFTFGPIGKQVKFLLLDSRYNQTSSDFLGKNQWSWLANELKTSKAQVHFIMTGIPFLPRDIPGSEEWANNPLQQEKLLKLIKVHKVPGVVFLSGDKHFAAITERLGQLEVMSSGLTHTPFILYYPFLKYYFPKSLIERNYGLIEIDWNTSPIQLKVSLKGLKDSKLTQVFSLHKSSFR
jgi:alkaline phosphatase D